MINKIKKLLRKTFVSDKEIKALGMKVVLARTAPPMNAEPNPEAVAAFNRYEEQRLIDEKLREEEEYYNEMIGWCQ